jgi:hypothetical protein
MISTAYRAVDMLELWPFMREDNGPFMLSNDKRLTAIGNKINDLGYDGHSGFSFSWTMRNIQLIATIGEEEYRRTFENTP